MRTQVVRIKSFEELLEVFPSMSMPQVILLYKSVVRHIERINESLGICTDEAHQNSLLDSLEPLLKANDFLSGYLARCYCKLRGVNLF